MVKTLLKKAKTYLTQPYGGLRTGFRRITAPMRPLPDFLIVGAQKAGTTSLYRWLSRHPKVRTSVWKEVHFFDDYDRYHKRGEMWYRSHFPLLGHRPSVRVGEATPSYLFNPAAPRRVAELIPNVRLIVLLRDPVDRAYSQYKHTRRVGEENLSFWKAVDKEEERVGKEIIEIKEKGKCESDNWKKYSYVRRGYYSEQIKRWTEYFPKKSFLFVKSEDMFKSPKTEVEKIVKHIGLNRLRTKCKGKKNSSNYEEGLDRDKKKKLKAHFEKRNRELKNIIGKNMGWN